MWPSVALRGPSLSTENKETHIPTLPTTVRRAAAPKYFSLEIFLLAFNYPKLLIIFDRGEELKNSELGFDSSFKIFAPRSVALPLENGTATSAHSPRFQPSFNGFEIQSQQSVLLETGPAGHPRGPD